MEKILLDRAKVITDCKVSPELQPAFYELCKKDILYRFRNFVYTDKNTRLYDNIRPSEIPFIPYEFQEEMISEIWESIVDGDPVFLEKSRQMGASWVIMAVFAY